MALRPTPGVQLRATAGAAVHARNERRLLGSGSPAHERWHYRHRCEPAGYGGHPPCAGYELVSDTTLQLDVADHRLADTRRYSVVDRGAGDVALRPISWNALLRCQSGWRPGAVAALVLVLRSPRGVHHGVAGIRNHFRSHPGLLEEAALWLWSGGGFGHRDRFSVRDRLGAPHVHRRTRRRGRCLLRTLEYDDRAADGYQGVLLASNAVARPHPPQCGDAVRARIPHSVHDRRIEWRPFRHGPDRLADARHVLCRS